jgi:protocatechuate 3,4-dioxygenase alpha subunit
VSRLTPFQTIGPFFDVVLRTRVPCRQVSDGTPGQRIQIDGVLADGEGRPIDDGLIETWQADAHGRYAGAGEVSGFDGYGWCHTDAEGRFHFDTIKPGAAIAPDGSAQAPHVLVSVLARGVLTRYITRVYFEDEPATATDPVLSLVPPERRATLVARRTAEAAYQFDIRLQGPDETVFFDA